MSQAEPDGDIELQEVVEQGGGDGTVVCKASNYSMCHNYSKILFASYTISADLMTVKILLPVEFTLVAVGQPNIYFPYIHVPCH